jgi:putative sterol carrier protein
MAHVFPSPEWVASYRDAINASEGYRRAGREWTHGVVAMVVKADPALGIERDLAMMLDVHQGECRTATLVDGSESAAAAFVIVSDYPRWKSVLLREVDPTKAMMQGKLRLTKGHMPTMIKFVQASKELVDAASHVATTFRDAPAA